MNYPKKKAGAFTAKKKNVVKKGALHPNNPHRGRYNFDELCASFPELQKFVVANPQGDNSIDFSQAEGVMCLNKALLAHYYNVQKWDIPEGYLCPPIPGRADYIHYLAEILSETNDGKTPEGKHIRALDIGTGANCIYPIIGSQSYGWKFVGVDIDPLSVKVAGAIVQANSCLNDLVKVVLQKKAKHFFKGIIKENDRFDVTVCNPPFHASAAEAAAGTARKLQNLAQNRKQRHKKVQQQVSHQASKDTLNFGGQKAELWCEGGEFKFISDMAWESVRYARQVCWFSSLISKSENVVPLRKLLNEIGAVEIRIVPMSQGQKESRFIAWSFYSKEDRQFWVEDKF